jgi:hypothetical protein
MYKDLLTKNIMGQMNKKKQKLLPAFLEAIASVE